MPSRRELLRVGSITPFAALAGCFGSRSTETRIGKILVQNRQSRANTIHLLVLCGGESVLWRTYQLEALDDPREDPPRGAVVSDVPADSTDCRVYARLNDEATARLDLGEHSMDCTDLHVTADETGGFDIFYSRECADGTPSS